MSSAFRRGLTRLGDRWDYLEDLYTAFYAYTATPLLLGFPLIGIGAIIMDWPQREPRFQRVEDKVRADPRGLWNHVVWLRRLGRDVSSMPGMKGVAWDSLISEWSP